MPLSKKKPAQDQESYKAVYDYYFYLRLHICWLLAVIAIFLGSAWWLVPLPGDSLVPNYRTYPSTILKAFFEGLAVLLAARSLVSALIKAFDKGIYPDSVIKFRTTGGIEAIFSGIRHKSGMRYFLVASLLPVAGLLGNLLQAEFQSSDSVFYYLGSSVYSIESAQCQHTTNADYSLASSAFSKGLITNSISDASSIIEKFNRTLLPNFSISLTTTRLTPIPSVSLQSTNTLVKRSQFFEYRALHVDNTESALNSATTSLIQPISLATLSVDGEPIMDLENQTRYIQTLDPIKVDVSGTNESVPIYIYRHTHTSNHKEAIIVVSDPPEHYRAGFYVSAPAKRYDCYSGNANLCSKESDPTSNLDSIVADALADAMRNNIGLYGVLTTDVLIGKFEKSRLADALLVNPLCQDITLSFDQGKFMYPYTRASWTVLAIVWSALLVLVWAIGAYLIGYTIDVFFRLTQSGNFFAQFFSTSTIFVDADGGQAINEKVYLDWKKIELTTAGGRPMAISNDSSGGYTTTTQELSFDEQRPIYIPNNSSHGYSVTTEEVNA
ncbi:hypothetical protein BY458DRAFT_166971 [Sporodiniella umbellata]|nr:hypothetical protein BY458DRAFT_166971 [Sporodiniella umbellata]